MYFSAVTDTTATQIAKAYSTSIHDFRRLYLKLNRDELMEMAHQPKDMILQCIYLQRIRQQEPFCTDLMQNGGTKIFSPTYGVCYMFNFKGINEHVNPLGSYMSGEEYGLQLTLNIESKQLKTKSTNQYAKLLRI